VLICQLISICAFSSQLAIHEFALVQSCEQLLMCRHIISLNPKWIPGLATGKFEMDFTPANKARWDVFNKQDRKFCGFSKKKYVQGKSMQQFASIVR
jgi:hypothetical protein